MLDKLSDPYVISGVLGLLAAALLLVFLNRKRPHEKSSVVFCYIFAVIFMFLGAHLLFFLVGLPSFSEKYGSMIFDVQTFLEAVFHASSGMVFYGGLFGALGGILLCARIRHLYAREYLNLCVCSFPLLHAFGRIGCALGGCCYGIEYHGLFAITYTTAHINPGISDHIADFPRFPVQPLEAAAELLICILLVTLYLRAGDRYFLPAVYLFAYGILRFTDEFLRGDPVRGFFGPFSTSQWIALLCVAGTVLWYLLRRRKASV